MHLNHTLPARTTLSTTNRQRYWFHPCLWFIWDVLLNKSFCGGSGDVGGWGRVWSSWGQPVGSLRKWNWTLSFKLLRWPPGGLTHAPDSRAACETNRRSIHIHVLSSLWFPSTQGVHPSAVPASCDAAGTCVFQEQLLGVYLYFSLPLFRKSGSGGRQNAASAALERYSLLRGIQKTQKSQSRRIGKTLSFHEQYNQTLVLAARGKKGHSRQCL